MLLLLFLFLLIVPVFGDSIFDFIKSNVSDVRAFDFFYRVFMIFKYPISVLILFFNIKLIYVISPDSSIESSSTTKGALFTTFGWIIASSFYSIYIGVFDTYNIYYGSISSILVLLLWVYVLSYIFVLGLIINASSYDL
jgi:membrane protein